MQEADGQVHPGAVAKKVLTVLSLIAVGSLVGALLGAFVFKAMAVRNSRIKYPWIRQEIHAKVEAVTGMEISLRLTDGTPMQFSWLNSMSGPDWKVGDRLDKQKDSAIFLDTSAAGGPAFPTSPFHPLEDVGGFFSLVLGGGLGGFLGAIAFPLAILFYHQRKAAKLRSEEAIPSEED
jgi:hypothetical protein